MTPPRPTTVGLGVAFGIGVLIAIQARINSALAAGLGGGATGGVVAALISFTTGFTLLCGLAVALGSVRAGLWRIRLAVRGGGLRWWQLAGGASGAFFVTSQDLVAGSLGVAVFTVAVIAGQTVSGLVIDRWGVGPAGRAPVTGPRMLGAVLTLLAVALAVSDRFSAPASLAAAALPALAGVAVSWQQAVNGRVGVAARSSVAAGWVNFALGAVLLVVIAGVVTVFSAPPSSWPGNPLLYLGGVVGVTFVTASAAVVRVLGVLLLGLGTVAGQLVGALGLDVLVPERAGTLSATTVLGSALTLVGVVVASRWRRGPVPASATLAG